MRAVLIGGFFVAAGLFFFRPVFLDNETFSTVGATQRVYFPWQITNENHLAFYPQADQAQTFYPRQVFIDSAIDTGHLPSWDPYTFAGHPYLSNGANGVFYPPRVLVTLVSEPALAHDLYLMLHMIGAGIGAYWLFRVLRFSTPASLLAGLAWMWNPFLWSWAQLELVPSIFLWLPIALGLVRHAHERRAAAWYAAAGMACGVMVLGSSLDLALAACG